MCVTWRPSLGQKGPGELSRLWQRILIHCFASAGSREDRCKMLGGMQPPGPSCLLIKPWGLLQTSHTNQQSQILAQQRTPRVWVFTWATQNHGSGQAVGKQGSRPHKDPGRNVSGDYLSQRLQFSVSPILESETLTCSTQRFKMINQGL